MRLYALHYLIPLTVCFTCAPHIALTFGNEISDGQNTPYLANISTLRSDYVIAKESPSSFPDTNEHQTDSETNSDFNLAFLPGLAILFLVIFVFFRACKWYRESSKIKDRGCSYDVASYVILVQGDKNFNNVDIGDNYDTVNSFSSYLRSGAYETITSARSLQYRMDSQMYDTVTSYSNYLQKMERENNLEIEMKQVSSEISPSPKRTLFAKKAAKSEMKLPQESRFSIKPALDNYMRLKGTNQKSPISPRTVRYDSSDRIDGTPRKARSKIIVNTAVSSESLVPNRACSRQVSLDSSPRSSPPRYVTNHTRLESMRRSVSEDRTVQSRDEKTKTKSNKFKNNCSNDKDQEFVQTHASNKTVHMVDAETQCQIMSPALSSKRRCRLVSVRSETESDLDNSAISEEVISTNVIKTDEGKRTGNPFPKRAITTSTNVRTVENADDENIASSTKVRTVVDEEQVPDEFPKITPDNVIQDGLKDKLSPAKVTPNVFSVCAVVHNVDIVSTENNGETCTDHLCLNNVSKTDDKFTQEDYIKKCPQNGSLCNRTDNVIIVNGQHHPEVTSSVESVDYQSDDDMYCEINGVSSALQENSCLLSSDNVSHSIVRRSSFQSKHDSAIEIQTERSPCVLVDLVH
ncbi:uncharacterized protein [Argopecten irradians]|uniref:uncharacterized protein n=1 Tax=Argopecten irradians TaxID=31199 RepID=UPI00371A4F9F